MDDSTEKAAPSNANPDNCLFLDEHTLSDLEVFDSSSGGQSLFNFCDHTRTVGGQKALERRMSKPWSEGEQISAVQAALCFIMEYRELFRGLPSSYSVARIELYYGEILPVVNHDNVIEFAMDAWSVWTSSGRHYGRIVQGVQISCRVVHTLRNFISHAYLKKAGGELLPLLEEMESLLDRPKLKDFPEKSGGLGVWQTLHLDRDLRVHEMSTMTRLLQIVYEIEALVSLADTTQKNNFTMPAIKQGELQICARDLVHPFVKNAIANPLDLDRSRRGLFLTGANMSGKTTYIRAFAVALYFAQLGMGVPAKEFRFTPIEQLYSSISLSDNLHSGVSYFRAEAMRVKEIAKAIVEGYNVVAIMDEPFKGTNVKDTLEASLAILDRFSNRENCLFIFSSHQIELRDRLNKFGCPVDCQYFSAIENEERLRFDYLLRPGVSQQRIGMRVLKEEGVFKLLDAQE
ncbi:Mismatch repair ATPase (MutS family) [Alteromonadaceae bacterium Bs31]|nr:Mismatch repair ATPase (MutS family) [Alteromonadaceae bacterium Bs31]